MFCATSWCGEDNLQDWNRMSEPDEETRGMLSNGQFIISFSNV